MTSQKSQQPSNKAKPKKKQTTSESAGHRRDEEQQPEDERKKGQSNLTKPFRPVIPRLECVVYPRPHDTYIVSARVSIGRRCIASSSDGWMNFGSGCSIRTAVFSCYVAAVHLLNTRRGPDWPDGSCARTWGFFYFSFVLGEMDIIPVFPIYEDGYPVMDT